MHEMIGTSKRRQSKREASLTEHPRVKMMRQLRVNSLPFDGEIFVYTESPSPDNKERSMRLETIRETNG